MDTTETTPHDAFRAVLCGDGLRRCPWAPADPGTLAEHDHRWGDPPRGAAGWFEALCLEILQAGLARGALARRREGLEQALRGFDPAALAALTEDDVDDLMLDPRVIRNRVKLEALVHDARACAGLGAAQWEQLVADLRPEHPAAPRTALELPARSAAGGTLAGRLRQRGVVFVGPTTAHQVLLRTGVLPGHLAGCFRAGPGSAGSG
ncbi:DNA-3-methyladenine glycosylase I [Kocuria flava]|uniref:DNA-3-methyladenine glycosylase I n=1 Tax=Kocuria flava TaxID=446860 RepID=UPI001FF2EC5C|nr:DNA-3-methyladenine glycosylase I [Kocuria flava]MCJ8506096.1 DNA-3-methyladenine glycosylase I [Kocuria flava]